MKNLLLVLGMSVVCGCFYLYLEDQRLAQEASDQFNNELESMNRRISLDSADAARRNRVTLAKMRAGVK